MRFARTAASICVPASIGAGTLGIHWQTPLSAELDFAVVRWLPVAVLIAACAPAAAAPAATEDPRVAVLSAQVANLGAERDALTAKTADLDVQMKILGDRLAIAQTTPTFSMWNSSTLLTGGHFTALGLPDTFTVRIKFSATTAVRTRIMTLDQYVRWRTTGVADAINFPASTSLDYEFHDAEGCAGYVVILDAARDSLISPDFVITRAANPLPTGVCAN